MTDTQLFVGGIALLAIGTGLLVAGFVGLTIPLACPINGCPSIFSSNFTISWVEIALGFLFVILGSGMVTASRRTRIVVPAQGPRRNPLHVFPVC
jgi:hypothetical protein